MVKVAILGFGTVGSGVAEVLDVNSDKIAKNAGQEIKLKYIVDIRDFEKGPYTELIVKDFSVVENDPEVTIVVETIGGTRAAYDFTKRSLLAGKSVITSNKELVATHGYELLKIAKEKNINYLFEASVGGGIPILRPISQCLTANKIDEIYGILNGTTNYILTEMIKNGMPFETALKQAQKNGYAELNPAADIEGHDACRKTCILSALCFGHHVYPDQVPTEGITGVTAEDVEFADKIGYRIKLLGRAILEKNGKVAAYVAPHLVSDGNLIASVDGVMNGIAVHGNAIGNVLFYGAGAGKLPTASAVVADIIDSAKHSLRRRDIGWEEGGAEFVSDPELIESEWYVRVKKGQQLGGQLIGVSGSSAAYRFGKMNRKALSRELEGKEILSEFRILD